MELINNIAKAHGGVSVFGGVGGTHSRRKRLVHGDERIESDQ